MLTTYQAVKLKISSSPNTQTYTCTHTRTHIHNTAHDTFTTHKTDTDTHSPALRLELQRSPCPIGGPCVIRISIPSGIKSHFSRHCSPRFKLNAQSQNSGCLYK